MKTPQELIRQLPDLEVLVQRLEEEPEAIISCAFPAKDPGLRERPMMKPGGGLESIGAAELPELEPAVSIMREPWVEAGTRAVSKIHREGENADLDPEEAFGLEAIVLLTGRPAILIQNGHFFPPPTGWEILEENRDGIEASCRSVGRIEVTGHPSYEWVGTGFLVAPDVVMTNAHVAEVFCRMGKRRRWKFKPGMTADIDYVEEFAAVDSAEFALRSVIGVHEILDMALFRVRRTSNTSAIPPEPLTIASRFPGAEEGRQVYAVGYPAWDGRRNDPEPMLRIFSNIFNVKRLQPGEIRDVSDQNSVFRHDCSTLGGNSGSCIVDLVTNQVIGLHFGGRYLEGNHAVALWQLTNDPLLQKAKANFA